MLAEDGAGLVDDAAGCRAQVLLVRKPLVSPSAMKQTSWLSGSSATASPRRPASARTWALGVSPSGNMAWAICSEVSTART